MKHVSRRKAMPRKKRLYKGKEIPEGLYQQKGSQRWWTCVQGYRASTGTDDFEQAKVILLERQLQAKKGEPIIRRADTITCAEGFRDLKEDYETHGERNLEEVGYRLKTWSGGSRSSPLSTFLRKLLTATSKCAARRGRRTRLSTTSWKS
jgi:hypothetical protein